MSDGLAPGRLEGWAGRVADLRPRGGQGTMEADVFISYSRRDADFVAGLAHALTQRGKQPWLDVQGIEDGEVFPQALRSAIEGTDGFVFVISPEAAASSFCGQEVDHALAVGKRIVPVLHRPVPDEELPEGIRERQWVAAGATLDDPAADRVVRALDADLNYARTHTRLLVRAGEWEARDRDRSALLRGSELREAEAWLTQGQGRDPAPTERHAAWIAASRAAAARRQRRLTAGAAIVALASIALLLFALVSRSQAQHQRAVAQSRALGTAAAQQLALDPQRSLLLANAGLRSAGTAESLFAAQLALDENTLKSVLPSLGAQACRDSSHMALLPGAHRAAVTTCDGRLVVLDLAARRIERTVRLGHANAVAVSPTGRTIAVGGAGSVALVAATTGRVYRRL